MKDVRVFLGIHYKSYTLTVECNGEYLTLPSKSLDTDDKYFITLYALNDILTLFAENKQKNFTLTFYSKNFDGFYEWKTMNEKKMKISETKNDILWKKINTLCDNNNIELILENNNSYMSIIGDLK